MIRIFIVTFCLLIAIPGHAEEGKEPAKTFNAEYFTLDNGLEIVVIPNHRTPVVTHMVWYKVGAADEPAGKSGIAHFLEHLLFKGSDGLAPGEFSKTVRALGGHDNAFTGRDYTAYYQSIAAEHLGKVMAMEAGRMRGLNPPLEEVQSERLVILEERRQRTDNDPSGRFQEQVNAALFVNHPYGTPVIGWFHEMEQLSWDDAKNFYDRWYGPNNAILIVSGDVTGEEVLALAKKTYGKIEPLKDLPAHRRTQSPPLGSETKVTLYHEAIHQPTVQMAFRVPSYAQNKTDALALSVLREIMGGGPTSRLYKSLVVEQRIASGAGLSYHDNAREDSVAWLYATPTEGVPLEKIESALRDELALLIEKGVTEQELNDAIMRLQGEAIYARDSVKGPAMVFGQAMVTGASVDDVEYWPDMIENVTVEQIQDVARRYLKTTFDRKTPVVTGFLLPAHQEEEDAGNE